MRRLQSSSQCADFKPVVCRCRIGLLCCSLPASSSTSTMPRLDEKGQHLSRENALPEDRALFLAPTIKRTSQLQKALTQQISMTSIVHCSSERSLNDMNRERNSLIAVRFASYHCCMCTVHLARSLHSPRLQRPCRTPAEHAAGDTAARCRRSCYKGLLFSPWQAAFRTCAWSRWMWGGLRAVGNAVFCTNMLARCRTRASNN